MMDEEGKGGNAGFMKSLINAYSPLGGGIMLKIVVMGKIAGALMAVDAIADAVPLIHGPVGCSFQRKVNPFKLYSPFFETPCTDMNDLEIVYGGEDKLRQGIKETYEKYHPKLIVVITTCASDLIGDDFKAAIAETKANGGIEDCDVVYTTGDFVGNSKPVGFQDALFAITDQMLCNNMREGEIEKNDGSVNIITAPIHGTGLRVAEMTSILNEMGIKINKVCFDHTTVKDLYELPKAELTISDFPMVWTKLMKERLGVDHYEIVAFERYEETKDPELFNPYGIEGSARVLMEIARRIGKEGEAEEVIARRKKDANERLTKTKEALGLEDKKFASTSLGGIHGIELLLLRDMGLKQSVIIHRTDVLDRLLSREAMDEVLKMSVDSARKYGSDPEILVNPTIEEEIKSIKENGTDLAISAGGSAYRYNKEGIRTFNPMDFMLHHLRIGFESPIELAIQLKEALKTPQKRNPLLSMLEFDQYRTDLTPLWVKLADIYGTVREGTIGDKDVYESMYATKTGVVS
jgi:nitrogenase molybdenum-cofactor synthesis protein NifE